MDSDPDTYDDVPYPSVPCRYSHPDTLATAGLLAGLSPAPVGRCRVLELGCSDGGNLIPMAYGLPDSEFIGIDRSPRAIEQGRRQTEALGLKNIRFSALSLMDLDESWGTFDYIVTHGVLSWVPSDVQDRILDLSRRLLNPQGLAYIDYNTYPGWHARGMVREMLLFHIRKESGAAAKVARAREFLKTLAGQVGTAELAGLTATDVAAYGAALRHEQTFLSRHSDAYLFHEHLEVVNQPFYFHEFAARAERQGLRYLSEASYGAGRMENLPPGLADAVRTLAGATTDVQQYLDFAVNRTFRQSVLCRADAVIVPEPDPLRLSPFHIASPLRPVSAVPDLGSFQEEVFNAPGGGTLRSGHPFVKAAMTILAGRWPLPLGFDSLLIAAREALPSGTDPGAAGDVKGLGETLLQCFIRGLVEFHASAPRYGTSVSGSPRGSRLARMQAVTAATVVNLRHEQVPLDEFSQRLLQALDGSRDLQALAVLLGVDREGVLRPGLERLAGSALLLP